MKIPRMLTAREVAEALGYSPEYLTRALLSTGRIKATRYGKNGWWRVSESDLAACIKANSCPGGGYVLQELPPVRRKPKTA